MKPVAFCSSSPSFATPTPPETMPCPRTSGPDDSIDEGFGHAPQRHDASRQDVWQTTLVGLGGEALEMDQLEPPSPRNGQLLPIGAILPEVLRRYDLA